MDVTREQLYKLAFFDVVAIINSSKWKVLNCFQYGEFGRTIWRVNLQRYTTKGSAEEVFTEFSDDYDPKLALIEAFFNAQARLRAAPVDKPTKVNKTGGLDEGQKERLRKALQDYLRAVQDDTRNRNRERHL